MQREDARIIVVYYRHIPDMLKLFAEQKRDIELVHYNSVKGIGTDGMPHGSSTSNTTERYGIEAAENGASLRLREVEKSMKTLEHDAAVIRSCIDMLNGDYKRVVFYKLISAYSWPRVGYKMARPESTCRTWLERALDRLAEGFSELDDVQEILYRASRAR